MFKFVLSRLHGKKLARRALCSVCLLEMGDMSTEWDHIYQGDKTQGPLDLLRPNLWGLLQDQSIDSHLELVFVGVCMSGAMCTEATTSSRGVVNSSTSRSCVGPGEGCLGGVCFAA